MPYETPPWTQVVAHRGNAGPVPENTLAAIESAIGLGVDMVEIDIRLTNDGIPILMHAERVDDTTSGSGLVADFTWEALKTLDAGSWHGPQFSDEAVPALDEVLDLAQGRVALNLDVKATEAVEPTVNAVIESGLCGSVVISGCTPQDVQRVRRMTKAIAAVLNLNKVLLGIHPTEANIVARDSIDQAVELGATAINVRHPLAEAPLVEIAERAGVGVWAYTIDEESRFVELADMGVASLTTNWPERMVPLVRRHSL